MTDTWVQVRLPPDVVNVIDEVRPPRMTRASFICGLTHAYWHDQLYERWLTPTEHEAIRKLLLADVHTSLLSDAFAISVQRIRQIGRDDDSDDNPDGEATDQSQNGGEVNAE
jgi:RecB family exonuclease